MERTLNAASGHAKLAEVAYRVGYNGMPGLGKRCLAAGGSSPLQRGPRAPAAASQAARACKAARNAHVPCVGTVTADSSPYGDFRGAQVPGNSTNLQVLGCASFSWRSGRLMPHPDPDSTEIPRLGWLESGKSSLLLISEKVEELQFWKGKRHSYSIDMIPS